MSFSFDGKSKDWIEVRNNLVKIVMLPISRELIEIMGRAGAVLSDTVEGIREITIPIDVLADSREQLERREEELAEMLYTKEAKELILSYSPNRKYYAVIDGSIELEMVGMKGRGVLTFLCLDPYKYKSNREVFTFNNGVASVLNVGTIPVAPNVMATVTKDITYADLYTNEGFIRIGAPADLEEVLVKEKERVLWDTFSNLTGWTNAGVTIDGGTVEGSFTVQNGMFVVSSYGASTKGWHGPSLKKGVPQGPLSDFVVDMRIKFPSPRDTYGRVEYFLLDSQSNIFAKIAMKRIGGSRGNTVEVRIGGGSDYKFILNYAGQKGFEWNDFSGTLRITRKGNVWTMYVAQIDANSNHSVRLNSSLGTYIDHEYKFTNSLSQIQIHAGKTGTFDVPDLAFYDLKIDKLNDVPEEDPRIIASAGDTIQFNIKDDVVKVNGEPREDLVVMAPPFPFLKKGVTPLILSPSDSFENATAEIEEGYL